MSRPVPKHVGEVKNILLFQEKALASISCLLAHLDFTVLQCGLCTLSTNQLEKLPRLIKCFIQWRFQFLKLESNGDRWMDEWVSEWIGVQRGMTLIGENGSTGTKTCQSSTLSANSSPAQIGLRSNSVLRGEMPCTSHGMVWLWFVLYCVVFINISYDIEEKHKRGRRKHCERVWTRSV